MLQGTAMSAPRSDDAYICHDCLALFLFKSDFERHAEETGHRMQKIKIDGTMKIGEKDFLLFTV